MACPFARRTEPVVRQASVADANWNIEDDLADIPDDALALTHLQLAIQLLTAPSVSACFSIFGFSLLERKPLEIFFSYFSER